MSRFPYTACQDLPTRTCLDLPTQKCLTLLTDRGRNLWYTVVAQVGSGNIEALVVARVREGGPYERSAADRHPGSEPGDWSAVLVFARVKMSAYWRPGGDTVQMQRTMRQEVARAGFHARIDMACWSARYIDTFTPG